jgi:hypothetical protein
MYLQRTLPKARMLTVLGLVIGALGIGILWLSGIEFPVYPPPGIVILLAAGLFGLTPLRWSPAVGSLLALFVFVGFLVSPTGFSNLTGALGTSVAIGQTIEVIGVLIAVIAGGLSTWINYRTPATSPTTAESTDEEFRS